MLDLAKSLAPPPGLRFPSPRRSGGSPPSFQRESEGEIVSSLQSIGHPNRRSEIAGPGSGLKEYMKVLSRNCKFSRTRCIDAGGLR